MNLRRIDLRWLPLDLDRVDFEAQPTCEGLFRLFLAKEELVRIQGQPVIFHALSRMLAQTTQLAASLFQSPCRILDYQACLRWQILGNGSHACVKSRRQRFNPKERLAAAYMLEQAARLARRMGCVVRGGQNARSWVGALAGHRFPDGVIHEAIDGPQGALGSRIEESKRLHLIAEQLDAHRMPVQRREDVHHGPAHGEGAGILHDLRSLEAHAGEIGGQVVARNGRPYAEGPAQLGKGRGRNHAPKKPGGRRQEQRRRQAMQEPVQDGKPMHGCSAVGLHFGVGAAFRCR